jgi:glycosyltransferase involved in cell wall biosynthesis
MTAEPDVGIVMPVYVQRHDYLREALRTMLDQTYRNFVLVVVVDGAPPDIAEVIRDEARGDPRVEILIKPRNEGTAKALNTGFDRLRQIDSVQLLTWVSSDNIHFPQMLERLRTALLESPENIGLTYGSYYNVDADRNHIPGYQPGRSPDLPMDRLIDLPFVGVAFMYRKRYAHMIDGYQMEPIEDTEYWFRLSGVCDFRFVPEELMEFRYEAPLSRTRDIHGSKHRKREFRLAFNLARWAARARRKIPLETTILFPVRARTQGLVEAVELLLDQEGHSNYSLILLDLDNRPTLTSELECIPDPRISVVAAGSSEKVAIRRALASTHTPFTLLFRPGALPNRTWALEDLASTYRAIVNKGARNIVSTRFLKPALDRANGMPRLGWKTRRWLWEPVVGELYRTEALVKILRIRG